MSRRSLAVALAVLALAAAAALTSAAASAALGGAQATPSAPDADLDFGDAPEGGLAYPALSVTGLFPTCMTIGPAAWVQHTNFGAYFGPQVDFEADGNAGACSPGPCFPPYDQDECFQDGDAGLIFPEPFTIDATANIVPCPEYLGTPLGGVCQVASWGANVDIEVTNRMPGAATGYFNLLVDWNQDGDWNDSVACPAYPGVTISEHAVVDFPVRNGFTGPLSSLFPPNFLIGPNAGYAWARFMISEDQVSAAWTGDGSFEDGESEDYLLVISPADPAIKWSQLPNRFLPGLHAHDYLNPAGAQEVLTLADDWLCQGGQVTDLHWWGNYELAADQSERRGAGIASFQLSIHVPDPQNPCLPQDPAAWLVTVPFAAVSETDTGLVNSEGSRIYRYTYDLPAPFAQDAGSSYWFDLSAVSVDINNPPMWRWQESARTTNPAFPPNNCGATQRVTPNPGTWQAIVWGSEPPRYSEMAFEVTSGTEVPESDLGDAPDSSNSAGAAMTAYPPGGPPGTQALFPTVYQAGSPPYGPLHWLPQNTAWLGPAVTLENEADIGPDQDPTNNIAPATDTPDLDVADDGLALPLQLPHCVAATITYIVTIVNSMPAPLYANVWFDWQRDGEWDDMPYCGQTPAPEWAVQNQVLALPVGTHVVTSPAFLPYHPPSGTDPNPLWMRISLSEQPWSGGSGLPGDGGSGPAGGYQFGETEDYYIERYLAELDWGDAPDGAAAPQYPTLAANNGARHTLSATGPFMGASVDADADGQPTAASDGDDTDADGDDEDGVTFPGSLQWGDPAADVDVDLKVSPAGCYVNGWMDFNGDYDWSDAGEQIIQDLLLAAGAVHSVQFAIPGTPPFAQGTIYARFRCSSAQGLGPTGLAADGEVEDYAVAIPDPLDWGDAPDAPYPTLAASNGAWHLILPPGPRLGTLIDAETDGRPSVGADGDDLAGIADEDGVTFTTPLLPSQTACVSVLMDPTGAPGLLNGWIDFDNDGAWTAAGEQVFTALPLVPGPNTGLCFAVPANAAPGFTYARFRLSSMGGLPPTGPAPDGEVEDYRVTVEAVKWSQPPVLKPESQHPECYWGWDEPSTDPGRQFVADDWQCNDSRPVTDIHWWGSYQGREENVPPQPLPASFQIGIWTDVPAGPEEPFSHPGTLLWTYRVPYAQAHERHAGCDYYLSMTAPEACYAYHVDLPQEAWFHQDPGKGIYWLSIYAVYDLQEPPAYPWGWLTRPHFFQDDAVRVFDPLNPGMGATYVKGEPIIRDEESWDLAFVLTTQAYDLGDAPDTPYPTLLASNGARHAQVAGGPFMGPFVDAEADGQPTASASGDDVLGLDDEDGVTFQSALEPGQPASLLVDLNYSAAGCYLNAWIDFNGDGAWDDSAGSLERIASGMWLNAGSGTPLSFAVPPSPSSVVGTTTARFRCSSTSTLSPSGPASDGEVEDYAVQVMAAPAAPVLDISIFNTTDVRLTWPPVVLDIYGYTISTEGYRIYRATAPYAALPFVASTWKPFPPGNITWDDAGKIGDPTVNYFYTVDAVLRDFNGYELYSVRSNEVGEFDFGLVPGSP